MEVERLIGYDLSALSDFVQRKADAGSLASSAPPAAQTRGSSVRSAVRHANYAAARVALSPAAGAKRGGGTTLRQVKGAAQAAELKSEIKAAAAAYRVDPELIGVIVMHESQAAERALFGPLADTAERAQAAVQGDDASIGIGQMRVGLAKDLAKSDPSLRGGGSVVLDLLDEKRAVRYIAAALADTRQKLRLYIAGKATVLGSDDENHMMVLAYNIGWEALRDRNLEDKSFGANIPLRVKKIRSMSRYLRYTMTQVPLLKRVLS